MITIRVMPSQRPRYKTKAEWAAAQANDMRVRASELLYRPSAGSVQRARKKYDQVATLHQEASRFDSMAARFKARGI